MRPAQCIAAFYRGTRDAEGALKYGRFTSAVAGSGEQRNLRSKGGECFADVYHNEARVLTKVPIRVEAIEILLTSHPLEILLLIGVQIVFLRIDPSRREPLVTHRAVVPFPLGW